MRFVFSLVPSLLRIAQRPPLLANLLGNGDHIALQVGVLLEDLGARLLGKLHVRIHLARSLAARLAGRAARCAASMTSHLCFYIERS